MAGVRGTARGLRGLSALILSACADALERRDNYLYQRRFVKGLLARYARKAKMFPGRYRTDDSGLFDRFAGLMIDHGAVFWIQGTAEEYYESAGANA